MAYSVVGRDPGPISATVAETQPAKDARNARFGPFAWATAWWGWQISGRGLGQPHYMPHALSSEPKLKAIQTLVLRPFFVGGKVW